MFLMAAAVGFLAACQGKKEVDLVVHNARVYTVDGEFSIREAFAIKDGKFVETGSSEDILNKYNATEVVDAGGLPVYPGFYDAHSHFLGFARTLMQADLMGSEPSRLGRSVRFSHLPSTIPQVPTSRTIPQRTQPCEEAVHPP